MNIPVIRRYTLATPAALNTSYNMTDDVTGLTQFLLMRPNAILDATNDPDPSTSTMRYEFTLNKNGLQTPITLFSKAMSPDTNGRVAVGPIPLAAGNFIWSCQQKAGTLTATSIIVKYANPLN